MFREAFVTVLLSSTVAFAIETVRIDMGTSGSDVTVKSAALSFGQDVDEGAFTPIDRSFATVRRVADRLELNGAPFVGEAIRFRVTGEPGIEAGPMRVRGEVVVRLHKQGLQLVNVVPLEEYLAAVLGSEMPVSFPEEALKAQAIAARTYALQRKLETYGQPFNLGSSVLSQVYGGVTREDPRTKAAVEATRGMVLTYELQPIEAYFHSSCGGRTETGQAALGRDLPYLTSVPCSCGKLQTSRWELVLPLSELRPVFGKEVDALKVASRTGTGRATRVAFNGAGRSVDAVSFRQKVGYNRLKSLSFEVEALRGEKVHITGHGFGHGAGLCQWGSKVYADGGWEFRKILSHYYPGAELQKIY